MPRKTEWIHRLDQALEELRLLPCPSIDRATVEKLFDVSPRQALRILDRLGAYRAGKSLLVDRVELIDKIEALRQDAAVQFERRRRERVDAQLNELRRQLAARRITIAARGDVRDMTMTQLPERVRLEPGELRIEFDGTEDLLARLLELSKAILNDYDSFEARIIAGRPA